MHIGIAGNIGCGKTTLTRMLAKHYGWTPKYESVTYNPYLEDYYKDIPRWSYNLETYFLAQRFKDVLEISKSKDVIIQDRTLYEGVYIFVANNLKCSIPHLVAQIQKRGRDYEQTIGLDYLSGLNERYDKWIAEYKGEVLTIETDNLDFENRPEDFELITDRIDARLYGLFPIEK